MRTYSAKSNEINRRWFVVDASEQPLGRLASSVAAILRGKRSPHYTPWQDAGDFVVVVNAEKILLTGNKMQTKEYIRYTGYPDGQRVRTAEEQLKRKPFAVVEDAVRGMLPKNRLGREIFRNLHVYVGPDHKHEAQQPTPFQLNA